MAILGIVLSFLIVFFGLDVDAAKLFQEKEKILKENALLSLKNCDLKTSRTWANRLDLVDPQFAALYRLTVLQKYAGKKKQEVEPSDQLRWKWSTEVWRDEHSIGLLRCHQDDSTGQSLSIFPSSILDEVILPLVDQYSGLRDSSQELVQTYLFYLWSKGRKIDLPKVESKDFNEEDSKLDCGWVVARMLHRQQMDGTFIQMVKDRCMGKLQKNRSKTILFSLLLGDHYFKNLASLEAYHIYRQLISLYREAEVSPQLWYRVAMTFPSAEPLDQFVRSVSNVLTLKKSFDPLHITFLRKKVCSHLSGFRSSSIYSTFKRVFKDQVLASKAIDLTSQCEGKIFEQLWFQVANRKLGKSISLSSKMKLYEEALRSSMGRSDMKVMARALGLMMALNRRAARSIFWKVVRSQGFAKIPSWVVSSYQKYGWSQYDQKLLERVKVGVPVVEPKLGQKVDYQFSSGEMSLKDLTSLPDLYLKPDFFVQFPDLLRTDYDQWKRKSI